MKIIQDNQCSCWDLSHLLLNTSLKYYQLGQIARVLMYKLLVRNMCCCCTQWFGQKMSLSWRCIFMVLKCSCPIRFPAEDVFFKFCLNYSDVNVLRTIPGMSYTKWEFFRLLSERHDISCLVFFQQRSFKYGMWDFRCP